MVQLGSFREHSARFGRAQSASNLRHDLGVDNSTLIEQAACPHDDVAGLFAGEVIDVPTPAEPALAQTRTASQPLLSTATTMDHTARLAIRCSQRHTAYGIGRFVRICKNVSDMNALFA